MSQTTITQFYQGVAGHALGAGGKNVAVMVLAQYITQTLVGLATPYWVPRFSHRTRIWTMAVLFVLNISVFAVMYGQSVALHEDEHSLLHFPRICILLCVVTNAVAGIVTEITCMQYTALYDGRTTNGFSTGSGIGGLLGASWAMASEPWPTISILSLLVFPVIIVVAFFYILPHHQRRASSRGSATKIDFVDEPVLKEETQNAFDSSKETPLSMTKMILITFWVYSLPLLITYSGFELIRSGFVKATWPKFKTSKDPGFYLKFNWAFRVTSAIGKSSTNFYATSKYWIFPLIVFAVGAVFGCVYAMGLAGVVELFLRDDFYGRIIVLTVLTLPLGFAYGSTSSNVYYALNMDVEDEGLREFVLGNMRQVNTYGQILGNVVAYILHEFVG